MVAQIVAHNQFYGSSGKHARFNDRPDFYKGLYKKIIKNIGHFVRFM